MTPPLPILPTTVIGSYSMPEWLERAKNDYLSRRLSRHDLDEMHDAVRKAAIKDQEIAGVDIVTDGEAQRDNMIDYFTERMPGVQVDLGSKRFYYDFYDSVVALEAGHRHRSACPRRRASSRRFTDHTSKISISGPHTLVKRIQNKYYPTEEAFALDLGARAEPRAEGAGAGRRHRAADRRAVLLRASPRTCRGRSRRSTRWSRA